MKQTRKDIQNAFLKLASTKPVDKITVKEIVEECSLNRNSFYYHFEDMSGLIESIIEDLFSEKYQTDLNQNPREAFLEMARDFQKNKYLCANIYSSREREYLDIRLSRLIHEIVSRYLESMRFSSYAISDEDRALIVEIYKAEIFGLFHMWLKEGSRDLADSFARIYDLREGTLRRMLERADQSGQSISR